jgi:hypothetical protein
MHIFKVRKCIQKFADWPPGRELQMVQFSATRCSCIAILCVSLVSFVVITLCVASQRKFIVVVVYLVMDSIRKLLDTTSYTSTMQLTSLSNQRYSYGGIARVMQLLSNHNWGEGAKKYNQIYGTSYQR